MKRKPLLDLLHQYAPTDAEEQIYKQKIIAFVLENENCFERSLSIGHITASSWLLDFTKTKALLMHHAKLNIWVQCGGHCDGDPDTLSVAIKEAQEESGLFPITPLSTKIFDLDIHLIPPTPKEPAHFHYDIRFLLQSPQNQSFRKNSESHSLVWIPKSSKNSFTQEPSILRMQKKWIELV